MKQTRENIQDYITYLEEGFIEKDKAIKELASALDRCVIYTKQFAQLSLGDQEKYKALANKYLDNTPPIKEE